LHWNDHIFGVTAVITDSGNEQLFAISKVAAAAGNADSVLSTVPADADALAFFPD